MSYIVKWVCQYCGFDHYWSFGPIAWPGSEEHERAIKHMSNPRLHICHGCGKDRYTGKITEDKEFLESIGLQQQKDI